MEKQFTSKLAMHSSFQKVLYASGGSLDTLEKYL